MSWLRAADGAGGLAPGPSAGPARIDALRAAYRAADPFPHLVLDDFLDHALAERLAASFPPPQLATVRRNGVYQNGKRGYRPDTLGEHPSAALLHAFNAPAVLALIDGLTGHRGLVPDPGFVGGGFHEIEAGGHLRIHADFLLHPRTGLARRVNLIVFLNRDWEESWGGALELWDGAMKACAVSIPPLFNRAVLFDTGRTSFHGHPDPLACPPGITRRSLALYYYGEAAPGEQLIPRTQWQARPGSGDGVSAGGALRRLLHRLRSASRLLVPDKRLG
ncbi:MAG: 2OG-Fe(II) oxygenase [Sphingomonas sp.]